MTRMRRAAPLVALAVLGCLLAGIGGAVVVTPDGTAGDGPGPAATTGTQSGTSDGAEQTADGTTNATTAGATLSGAVVAEESTLDGQLRARNYDRRLARANTSAERVAVLRDIQSELTARVDRLEQRRNETLDGTLSPAKRLYLATTLRVDADMTARIAADSADVAVRLGETDLAAEFDRLANDSVALLARSDTGGLLAGGTGDILDGDTYSVPSIENETTADDPVDDTDGTINDTINETNETVNDTVGETNETVDDTVGETNETVDDTVNETVDDTVDGTNETVEDTNGTLDGTDGSLDDTDDTLNETDGTLDGTDGTPSDTDTTLNGTDGTLDTAAGTETTTSETVDGTDGVLSLAGGTGVVGATTAFGLVLMGARRQWRDGDGSGPGDGSGGAGAD
jgi:hypothetical protein